MRHYVSQVLVCFSSSLGSASRFLLSVFHAARTFSAVVIIFDMLLQAPLVGVDQVFPLLFAIVFDRVQMSTISTAPTAKDGHARNDLVQNHLPSESEGISSRPVDNTVVEVTVVSLKGSALNNRDSLEVYFVIHVADV